MSTEAVGTADLDGRVEPAPVDDDPVRSLLVARVAPPPTRAPVVVLDHPGPVAGERVVWQSPKGWHFDLRAAGEPYASTEPAEAGRMMVDVVSELDWYRQQLTGEPPTRVAAYAHTVFVERPTVIETSPVGRRPAGH